MPNAWFVGCPDVYSRLSIGIVQCFRVSNEMLTPFAQLIHNSASQIHQTMISRAAAWPDRSNCSKRDQALIEVPTSAAAP